jgi:ectoine hydroxylase-related dioxygenase (phytanoyl-CoA dioxygenase family)
VQGELVRALLDGPGVVVLGRAFADPAIVDRASEAFSALVEEERATGSTRGDHFANPGANDRVWNALDKVAVPAPEVFADYYANDMLALIAEAWLGPGYQVTSQINVVNPGGAAQSVHRDYHLGFLSQEGAAAYPAHVHRLSPVLTLQGAVAHCDMPVESGPTLYLPHSQKYQPGYLAWRLPEFIAYFEEHHVQLPLLAVDHFRYFAGVVRAQEGSIAETAWSASGWRNRTRAGASSSTGSHAQSCKRANSRPC